MQLKVVNEMCHKKMFAYVNIMFNRLVSQYACCELVWEYNRLLEVLYVFEHDT